MDRRSFDEHVLTSEDGPPTERRPTVRPLADTSGLPTRPASAVPSGPPAAPPRSSNPLSRFNTWLLSHFVTNPSSGRSLGYVDGLRALAALGVVILHTNSEAGKGVFILPLPFTSAGIDLTPLIYSGGVGVYLFFVLSGFLLSQPWIEANYAGKPRPDLKHYFVLRFTRIVPPFYVAVAIVVIFFTPSLVPASMVYSRLGLFDIISHLLFIQFLFPVFSASFNIAGQFWSLTIEMLFYLMLPLAARAFYRRRWMIALPLGMLISISYRGFFFPLLARHFDSTIAHLAARMGAPWYTAPYASFYIENQFPAHAFEFALGMALANLYIQTRLGRASSNRLLSLITSRAAGGAMFIAGLLITVGSMYLNYPSMPLIHVAGAVPSNVSVLGPVAGRMLATYFEPVQSVGFALILAGAIYGHQIIRAVFSFTPLRIIGIVSYSVYLLHLPLLHNIVHIYPHLNQTPNTLFVKYLVTVLAQMLPISIVLYLAVERPIMSWARKRRPAPASAPHPEPVPTPAIPSAAIRAPMR
jgi:peptidoglycan/LPS O-acetylase OafA/YrhL